MAVSTTELTKLEMHPGFFFFPRIVPEGPSDKHLDALQVDEALMLAAAGELGYPITKNGQQRLLNFAVKMDTLDFHLTLTLEAGTDKVKSDVHFAIRKDSVGHNEVLYWWYRLARVKGSDALCFKWIGCAGSGDAARMSRNHTPGVQYGTTAGDILARLLTALAKRKTSIAVNHKSKVLTLS